MTATTGLPLSQQCWINAAAELLRTGGINTVHITKLARVLGVSRGSFYWHFKNRNSLLDMLLQEWQNRNTRIIVEAAENTKSLSLGVIDLFAVWTGHDRFDPKLDQAVRDWAHSSKAIAIKVQQEDDNRINAIAALFIRFDFPKTEALIRARVLYFTQLGYYALNIQETASERLQNITSYFLCFTGRPIDENSRNLFAKLIQPKNTIS